MCSWILHIQASHLLLVTFVPEIHLQEQHSRNEQALRLPLSA